MGVQPEGKIDLAGAASSDCFKDFALACLQGGADEAGSETTVTSRQAAATQSDYVLFRFSSSEADSGFARGLNGTPLPPGCGFKAAIHQPVEVGRCLEHLGRARPGIPASVRSPARSAIFLEVSGFSPSAWVLAATRGAPMHSAASTFTNTAMRT